MPRSAENTPALRLSIEFSLGAGIGLLAALLPPNLVWTTAGWIAVAALFSHVAWRLAQQRPWLRILLLAVVAAGAFLGWRSGLNRLERGEGAVNRILVERQIPSPIPTAPTAVEVPRKLIPEDRPANAHVPRKRTSPAVTLDEIKQLIVEGRPAPPRKLTPRQRLDLAKFLKPPGLNELQMGDRGGETHDFADSIKGALVEAGWRIAPHRNFTVEDPAQAKGVSVIVQSANPLPSDAKRLESALRRVGIDVRHIVWDDMPPGTFMLHIGDQK